MAVRVLYPSAYLCVCSLPQLALIFPLRVGSLAGGMGGMGMGGMGIGMGMNGMMGQDPNDPNAQPPMPPPRWQTILQTLNSVMMVFGRISFLVDENTQVRPRP
jgi:hypothetical protein